MRFFASTSAATRLLKRAPPSPQGYSGGIGGSINITQSGSTTMKAVIAHDRTRAQNRVPQPLTAAPGERVFIIVTPGG